MHSLGARRPRLALAAALFAGAMLLMIPLQGYAAEPGVYTATAVATYANPDTGAIEDAAGDSNMALGQSMVEGVVHPECLIEVDDQGQAYLTLRFNLANEIGEVQVWSDTNGMGEFGQGATAQQVQVLGEGDVADYRFAIPSENATERLSMYVEPMGREVTYFVKVTDLVMGNSQGFVESEQVPEPPAEPASQENPPVEASASAHSGPTSSAAQSSEVPAQADEAAPLASSTESAPETGVREYSGDGNEVTGAGAKTETQAASALNYPLIVGGLFLLAAVVALVAYLAVARPKNARQDAAAAAAAGARTPSQDGRD